MSFEGMLSSTCPARNLTAFKDRLRRSIVDLFQTNSLVRRKHIPQTNAEYTVFVFEELQATSTCRFREHDGCSKRVQSGEEKPKEKREKSRRKTRLQTRRLTSPPELLSYLPKLPSRQCRVPRHLSGKSTHPNSVVHYSSLVQFQAVEKTLFASVEKKTGAMVVRPNYGTAGRKVNGCCNLFPISWTTNAVVQYEVTVAPVQPPSRGRGRGRGRGGAPAPVTPRKLRPELCREIFKLAFQNGRLLPPGSSYDGKGIMYVPGNGVQDLAPKSVNMMIEEKQKKFSVTLKETGRIGLNQIQSYLNDAKLDLPQQALAALDVTFRHVATMDLTNSVIGSGIFKLNPLAKFVSPGVQAWAGYTQSVYPCQNGVYLNLNSSFKPFVKEQTVAEFMVEVVSDRLKRKIPAEQLHTVMNPDLYKHVEFRLGKLCNELKKLKVKTIHNRQHVTYPKLAGFARDSSLERTFPDRSGRQINVVEFMRTQCGFTVKYPHLKLLETLKKDRICNIALPPECVLIKAQNYKKELNQIQKTRLIQAATRSPEEKRKYIEECLKTQLNNPQNVSHLRALGMKVGTDMLKIEPRVLKPPLLECGDGQVIDPKEKGEWDLRDHKFAFPIKVKSWAMVNFCKGLINPLDLKQLFEDLQAIMNKKGMEVSQLPYKEDARITDIHLTDRILRSAVDGANKKFGANCQIIMVILPPDSREPRIDAEELYQRVKIASDQLIGVPTQCLHASVFGLLKDTQCKNRESALHNLTKKMNAKMGGGHSILYTPPDHSRSFTYPLVGDRPFMVMGADLTHPAPGSDDPRSVAGVVGSLDQHLSQFACRGLVQEKGENGREVIMDLKSAVKDLLLAFFKKNNGLKPEAILFYRDGVSQGEFQKVLDHEYKAIKKACSEMGDPGADYNPRVTFITVQKRHNMMIFPADKDAKDASGNFVPGTVEDSTICHPHGFDFYLLSHAGIQGTSKAALYSVLADENHFDADSLQILTYWMCYVFCRCTRSVSYCPPAYYAHHAAARCKILYLNAENEEKAVHENLKDTLFFA